MLNKKRYACEKIFDLYYFLSKVSINIVLPDSLAMLREVDSGDRTHICNHLDVGCASAYRLSC